MENYLVNQSITYIYSHWLHMYRRPYIINKPYRIIPNKWSNWERVRKKLLEMLLRKALQLGCTHDLINQQACRRNRFMF